MPGIKIPYFVWVRCSKVISLAALRMTIKMMKAPDSVFKKYSIEQVTEALKSVRLKNVELFQRKDSTSRKKINGFWNRFLIPEFGKRMF